MRNRDVILSDKDARRAQTIGDILSEVTHRTVVLDYTTRGGERRLVTGRVAFFNGTPGTDKHSVTVETADGYRTLNLYRIRRVS